ncbi:hypothetical protein PC118_g21615 [Phytophthora cactorum]|uniref:Uncharacterized protein n=1 Tax=Phytophthora cactorum TaxID=29920 RepID=A0A8T1EZH8_9STRA|nr:hypothetical protein PC114_g23224 [Phytophthora cactorum]KAG2962077.1 hypothetical protein PC118_g21615 [Phytophthora cactorum]KAG2964344.1 hypothetical protein PC119_g25279 [Phytophthora cactorum]
MVNFNIGDYVLRSRVDEKVPTKLLVTWVGPYAVTAALAYNVLKLKHLVTGDDLEVHASRLKFFTDKDLDVAEEFLEHVCCTPRARAVAISVERPEPGLRDTSWMAWFGRY